METLCIATLSQIKTSCFSFYLFFKNENSESRACSSGTLPFDPYLHPFFAFSYFSGRVLHFYFGLGLALDLILPHVISTIAGITDVYHHARFI
jgi:hypothetical protein